MSAPDFYKVFSMYLESICSPVPHKYTDPNPCFELAFYSIMLSLNTIKHEPLKRTTLTYYNGSHISTGLVHQDIPLSQLSSIRTSRISPTSVAIACLHLERIHQSYPMLEISLVFFFPYFTLSSQLRPE